MDYMLDPNYRGHLKQWRLILFLLFLYSILVGL